MIDLTRRRFLKAMPIVGAAAAIPALALAARANAGPSVQEQIDYHIAELVKLVGVTAGPCDGWRLAVNVHPWDKPKPFVKAERYWAVPERLDRHSRTILVDRMRTFDHRTGQHNDYDPMVDLSHWVPREGSHV